MVAQERDEEGTTTADGRSETHMNITINVCAVLLFGSGALLHDDLFSLAQSEHMRSLHFLFFSAEGTGWQWTFRTLRPRSLLWNPMNTTNTTYRMLCWNFYVTHILVYSWKQYSTRKIPGCIAFSCHFALEILRDKE